MNFEVYGQNSSITPEAGEKKAPFLKILVPIIAEFDYPV